MPVPVYETAFALSHLLEERSQRDVSRITIINPVPDGGVGDAAVDDALANETSAARH